MSNDIELAHEAEHLTSPFVTITQQADRKKKVLNYTLLLLIPAFFTTVLSAANLYFFYKSQYINMFMFIMFLFALAIAIVSAVTIYYNENIIKAIETKKDRSFLYLYCTINVIIVFMQYTFFGYHIYIYNLIKLITG